jgi:hypothetical protein
MSALSSIVESLNGIANVCGRLLTPIGWAPGWLSATCVAIATGVAMLIAFKYTSNQRAIKNVRRGIKANLLSVKLFKDNIRVALGAQVRVLVGALRLLLLAIVPMLAMMAPMVLLLAQLGLWYQAAPVPIGGETVVTLKLGGESGDSIPEFELASNPAIEQMAGPVMVASKREVCWIVRANAAGYHRLEFRVAGVMFEKELAAGEGVMRVSPLRPGTKWSDRLLNPREMPFDAQSLVQAIEIEYPTRSSWTCGADNWVIYWFVVSLVAGFCLRGVFKVNL